MRDPGRELVGVRALVTGASGFIGGRLVERLALQCDARVRVLVRSFASAAPLARFPVEIVRGDVLSPKDVTRAAGGCDVVFHCAKGTSWILKERRAVDVEGTRNVLEAALRAGSKRVVHLSTLLVYGLTPDGDLDERAGSRRSGDCYAESKIAAERIALDYARARGLPVAILQPTAVYGPNAGVYTRDILEELRSSRVILVNGGTGLCNLVYVDDLVTAILLAAVAEQAPGEAFLISGAEPVTWREFYARFERMLGVRRTVSMSEQEAIDFYRRSRRGKWLLGEGLRILREDRELRRRLLDTREGAALMAAAQAVLPRSALQGLERRLSRPLAARTDAGAEPALGALRPFVVRFLATRTRVQIDKARRLLGYEPVFDFATGMSLTEQWARWAGLLDGEGSASRLPGSQG